MNLTVPHLWLKDFLETKVTPHEIARDLSLFGPTVELLKAELSLETLDNKVNYFELLKNQVT